MTVRPTPRGDASGGRGRSSRPFDAETFALIASLAPEQAERVGGLARERDHLFTLLEALGQAEKAPARAERLRTFVEAIRATGFERVTITLRDAAMEPTLRVSAGVGATRDPDDAASALAGVEDGGAAWRRRFSLLEPFRLGESYWLERRDPWVAREFARRDPTAPMSAPPTAPASNVLLVPLRAADGGLLATLAMDAASDAPRPSLSSVRALELFAQQIAQHLERERIAALSRERAERLQALQQVSSALARHLDEAEIVDELARAVQRLVPCDGVLIARPDLERGLVTPLVRLVRGEPRPVEPVPLAAGPVAEVARTGRPILLADYVPASSRLAASDDVVLGASPARSVLAVPMMIGIQLIGVLGVHAEAPGAYRPEDAETLLTVGAQAASAISNARLYAESQRERRQSSALADVARAVSESLRTGEVMRRILRHAMALLGVEGACVVQRDGDYLNCVAAAGIADLLAGVHIPMHGSLMGRATRDGVAVISNDVPSEPDDHRRSTQLVQVTRAVMVPLVTARGTIGALCVFNRDTDFTDEDARVLQRLADQVAVAIVNARLYEEVADSTREWSVAFDAIASGMVVLDELGRIARYNSRATQLAGFERPQELRGRYFYEVLLHEPRAIVEGDPLHRALEEDVVGRATVHARARGRVFEVVAAPHPNGGAVVTFEDVTTQHERDEALRRSEARWTNLVESASDAIFTGDAEGRFLTINRALEEVSGRRREELAGVPIETIADPRDRAGVREMLALTLQGRVQRREVRYLDANGATRTGSVLVSPVVESGSVTGVLGVVRDVTEEKMLLEQLLQQEKLAAIGQLVSGVAHELNNPLASVMAFSQLLLASSEDPAGATPERIAEDAEMLRTIHDEAKRAAKIVSNLLTFARQHAPQRAATSLNQVILATVELRRYALGVQNVELELDLDEALPLTWADPFQLQQVFLNLLSNAEQALAGWAGRRRIAITSRRVGGRLVATVSDSGPGISAEQIDQIFNPFFTTKTVGKGTGLGLSISDGIVREHGGCIVVESVSGVGASFSVELPLVDPPGTSSAPEPRPADSAAPRGPRSILVVDDEPAIRTAIARYFGGLGHIVDAVGSGTEALARVDAVAGADRVYDAIILDVRMADMSGDQLYRRLVERHPEQARRIVFLTGDVQGEETAAFLASTDRPSLVKPFALEELGRIVLSG